MKALIVAILLALTLTPAHAEACKPPAAKYVHTGQAGSNFFMYGWCTDTTFIWAYLIPSDASAERLKIDTDYWLGLDSVIKPQRAIDDPLMLEIWAAAFAAMAADTDRPPSAAGPVALVAPNGKYTTRPAYPVIDGAPGTKEAARATIGEACGCDTTRIMRGSVMYCAAPPPNAALVTVCRVP